jgi:hypothetical protein
MLVETNMEKKIASLPVTAGIITGLHTEFKVAAVTTTQTTEVLPTVHFKYSQFTICIQFCQKKKRAFGVMHQCL